MKAFKKGAMKTPKLKEAIKYVNRVAQDGKTISVFWKYVERYGQLPPHHLSFDGERFIECLKVVMAGIICATGRVTKSMLTEGRVRKGGTESKPTTSKPNIKPAGQKTTKRLITYNDRIVGPQ